jgi:hypothetical protein
MTKKYYLEENIGYGYERIWYVGPFDTYEEGMDYIANSQEGSFDGHVRIEEYWVEEED